MPTYKVQAINIGSFNLGESDKLLTLFTKERGLIKAVAKGARKPGAKMTGRSELLHVNTLLISNGRTLDIISQAETQYTYPALRKDLARLSYALYYAELTQIFGDGLQEDSQGYFDYLCDALRLLSGQVEPSWLVLRFEMGLLAILGYYPELTYCVGCRQILTDYVLAAFHKDWGGVICSNCLRPNRAQLVAEGTYQEENAYDARASTQITPLVWKQLILAGQPLSAEDNTLTVPTSPILKPSVKAARRLIQGYIEHRAGKRIKSLDLLAHIEAS